MEQSLFAKYDAELKEKRFTIFKLTNEPFSKEDVQTQTRKIIDHFVHYWKHQFELLCYICLQKQRILAYALQTYTNISQGIILQTLSGSHNIKFAKSHIIKLQIVGIFQKHTMLDQIKRQVMTGTVSKTKVYKNKSIPDIIVIDDQQEQKISPLPRATNRQMGKKLEVNKRKLLIKSESSQSQEYYFKQSKNTKEINTSELKNMKQNQTKSLLSEKNSNKLAKFIDKIEIANKQGTKIQQVEKKSINQRSTSLNVNKQTSKRESQKIKQQAQIKKQSSFMSLWMNKK